MTKYIVLLIAICSFLACNESIKKPENTEFISDTVTQAAVFNDLIKLTNNSIEEINLKDSMAFLILPVKLSCPACRKKTIDSIVKHQNNMPDRHIVIISAAEGIKNIRSYFEEQHKELPVIKNQLFLDSTHQAYKYKLVKENPVIFYALHQKVYKKVLAIPATVKDDLCDFFSGPQDFKPQNDNR